jgi:hypothetical protein
MKSNKWKEMEWDGINESKWNKCIIKFDLDQNNKKIPIIRIS